MPVNQRIAGRVQEIISRWKKTGTMVLTVYLLQAAIFTAAASQASEATLVIPTAVLADLVQNALPIELEKDEDFDFSGKMWIQSIENLRLGKNMVYGKIHINGKDVHYSRKIGRFEAAMKIGDVRMSFNCGASIRYDQKKRILILNPRISPAEKQHEILTPLLIALINDNEFPVQIEKLQPIVTQLGEKTLTVEMDISGITTQSDRLMLEISPAFRKSPK
ncbi:MAG: hypothetical protein AB1659_07325 [Thermodesulfobacteriota bacterium]